jgi:uncharacterized phage infection (PIP) family protein YhgE
MNRKIIIIIIIAMLYCSNLFAQIFIQADPFYLLEQEK